MVQSTTNKNGGELFGPQKRNGFGFLARVNGSFINNGTIEGGFNRVRFDRQR